MSFNSCGLWISKVPTQGAFQTMKNMIVKHNSPNMGVIHVSFPFELHPNKPSNTSQIVASFTLSILKIAPAINFQEDKIL